MVQPSKAHDLATSVKALVAEGALDIGSPTYEVALTAIGRGYDGLTRLQKRLFDQEIASRIGWSSEASRVLAPVPRADNPWRPMHEAPHDRDVQLGVKDGEMISPISEACHRVGGRWAISGTGKRLFLSPTHWREWRGTVQSTL